MKNKILIVDDEPTVRTALKRVLVRSGYEVSEASDGEEGLEQWKAVIPDLVLLDVLMPKMTGPELLERIDKRNTKVILISAYTGEYNLEVAKNLGADLYIPKPFEDIFAIPGIVESLLE